MTVCRQRHLLQAKATFYFLVVVERRSVFFLSTRLLSNGCTYFHQIFTVFVVLFVNGNTPCKLASPPQKKFGG